MSKSLSHNDLFNTIHVPFEGIEIPDLCLSFEKVCDAERQKKKLSLKKISRATESIYANFLKDLDIKMQAIQKVISDSQNASDRFTKSLHQNPLNTERSFTSKIKKITTVKKTASFKSKKPRKSTSRKQSENL